LSNGAALEFSSHSIHAIALTGTIGASPMVPWEKHVNAVLCLLRGKRYPPIYVHCDLGRDRAMLVVGLHAMYYHGKSKEEAYKEMKYYGFNDRWGLTVASRARRRL